MILKATTKAERIIVGLLGSPDIQHNDWFHLAHSFEFGQEGIWKTYYLWILCTITFSKLPERKTGQKQSKNL